MTGCSHWVGTDLTGHRCDKPTAEGRMLCERHWAIELRRTEQRIEKRRQVAARSEAVWLARHIPQLPAMRVQLERAEAEYTRRTASAVADRAAYGGATHTAVTRSQRNILSDSNITRVVELQRIIERLRADIARAEKGTTS